MPTAVRLLFFAAAWLGHAFTLTVALNLIYSFAIPRKLQRGGRLAVAVAVFGFPFAYYWWRIGTSSISDMSAFDIYLWACVFIGGVVFPIITIGRLFRRTPSEIVYQSSNVINIARELGNRPLGFGEHWRMGRLPFNQILEVEYSEITLRIPQLPHAWDGMTILHVSDLHFHGTPERSFFIRALTHAMDSGPPDLLCLTGDFVDTIHHLRWIKPLLGLLTFKEAGLAILGNHDFWCEPDLVRRQLKRTGLSVIGNGWTQLSMRGEPLVVIGHEGPWFIPAPDLSDCPPDPFRLCLSHTPDNIPWAANHNVDLLLAGHVHGGQIRLPVVGSLFVPSRFSRKFDGGCYKHGNTIAYVTRGLSGREPLRWKCRPEITRIRLVS